LRIVRNWWLISSFGLHGNVREVVAFLRSGHRRHIIVDLDVRRHGRRLTNRLRSRIPWEVSDLESRQPFLPTLTIVSLYSA
jgi:hypothetical protein